MNKRYPFKFLDAYERQDVDFFFGREEEIEALYRMVFQSNLLVVYGSSGTGKTSLIQCGLANKFQTYDWLPLYIRRGKNLLAALDKQLCAESDEVFEYQEREELEIPDLAKKIEAVYRAAFKPLYLIFDQFEELYILGDKAEQEQFVKTVQEILRSDKAVKIIISIREEYLGQLYNFEREVPELMRKKLRVEPMNRDKVVEVIENVGSKPSSLVRLQTGEEKAIGGKIFDTIHGEDQSLSIPLPYLQVFLDRLYVQITGDETRQQEAELSLAALAGVGKIEDVLRSFLDEQVFNIAQELAQGLDSIWPVLSAFATLEGTKKPLSEAELRAELQQQTQVQELTEAELATRLEALVKKRILRLDDNEQRYELAHDSLAKHIAGKRSEEEIALLEVQRLLKSQTSLKVEARSYFSENQLAFIEPFLEKLRPTEVEQAWLETSRGHWAAEREKVAQREREELERARAQAELERMMRAEAEVAKEEAEKQRGVALEKEQLAKENEVRARQRTRVATVLAVVALLGIAAALLKTREANQSKKDALVQKEKAIEDKERADSLLLVAEYKDSLAQQEAKNARAAEQATKRQQLETFRTQGKDFHNRKQYADAIRAYRNALDLTEELGVKNQLQAAIRQVEVDKRGNDFVVAKERGLRLAEAEECGAAKFFLEEALRIKEDGEVRAALKKCKEGG